MNRLVVVVVLLGACHHSGSGSADLGGFDLSSPCVAEQGCALDALAACHEGRIRCDAEGPRCVDTDSPDGTACAGGLCSLGNCDPPLTLASDANLTTTPVTPGRSCAEAPAYSVIGLDTMSATLATAPDMDCLVPGDQVMLVNLQGTAMATSNVGNWELLRVASVSGPVVTFVDGKTRIYGAMVDDSIGIDLPDQKVELVRVPHFGELTLTVGHTITVAGWNGLTGGVLAMRPARLDLDGTISVVAGGYRSGQWSDDDDDCSDNIVTESGESIDGPATASTDSHAGAPGGLPAMAAAVFVSDTPINAGAGHATGGEAGLMASGRIPGPAGGAYGVADATKLTMGSGASGNMTCNADPPRPPMLTPAEPTLAGGIIALFANQVIVNDGGAIRADALAASRSVSASGGYVFLIGSSLSLGTGLVSAEGAAGTDAMGVNAGMTVKSSDGYVVLSGQTITGTTVPPAHVL